MRDTWQDWVHAVWSTRGHWLPGDPRGFRDHDHRIHSTGHYKAPPPRGEHAGLHAYSRTMCPDAIEIPECLRDAIAEALGAKLIDIGSPARIIAVAPPHVHALVRAGKGDARPAIGRAKQAASHAVRRELPGSIWGQRCHPRRIRNEKHFREVVEYIAAHEHEGASVWIHPQLRGGSAPESCR